MSRMLCILTVLLATSAGFCATINVPDEAATIQAAVDAALDGDTVLIAPGTYSGDGNWDVDIFDKDLCVRGAGPETTVIDCAEEGTEDHRAFVASSQFGNSVTIENLSIINGTAGGSLSGAGIASAFANLRVSNCLIRDCRSTSPGGAISMTGGSLYVVATQFSSNLGFGGGALYLNHCSPTTISGCQFDTSYSLGNGGGAIWADACTVSVSNSFFIGSFVGGGFPVSNRGGAVLVHSGEASFSGCAFYDNKIWELGGAVAALNSNVTFDSCTFSGNESGNSRTDESGGAALYLDGGSAAIRTCSFSHNHTYWASGAVMITASSYCQIENSIMAFTANGTAVEGSANLTCTDIFGNELGDWVGEIADQAGINGNFSLDPLFCDTATGDLKLQEESPCAPGGNDCGVRLGSRRVGCEVHCGDANGDAIVNVSDAVYLISYIFSDGPPTPYDNGDADCSGAIDISDAVYLLNYIFSGGPAPCAACP